MHMVRDLALVIALGTAFAGCLQDGQEPAATRPPDLSIMKTETDDRWTIARAEGGQERSDFLLGSSVPNVAYAVDGSAPTDDTRIDGLTRLPPGVLEAGSTITFCALDRARGDVQVTLVHGPTDTEMASLTFQTLATC